MNWLNFPTDDPLWLGAVCARNAAQDLFVACHYAGCKSGVGRQAKGEPKAPPADSLPAGPADG
jgi:hypothetical protein